MLKPGETLVIKRRYPNVPDSTYETLEDYVNERWEPGGSITAVLSNDLFDAMARCDMFNAAALPEICKIIHNDLPAGCWGSRLAVKEWLEGDKQEPVAQEGKEPEPDNETLMEKVHATQESFDDYVVCFDIGDKIKIFGLEARKVALNLGMPQPPITAGGMSLELTADPFSPIWAQLVEAGYDLAFAQSSDTPGAEEFYVYRSLTKKNIKDKNGEVL